MPRSNMSNSARDLQSLRPDFCQTLEAKNYIKKAYVAFNFWHFLSKGGKNTTMTHL